MILTMLIIAKIKVGGRAAKILRLVLFTMYT
jgi:hypothetical protein